MQNAKCKMPSARSLRFTYHASRITHHVLRLSIRGALAYGDAEDQRAEQRAEDAGDVELRSVLQWKAVADDAADHRPEPPREDRRADRRASGAPEWPGPHDHGDYHANERPDDVCHCALHVPVDNPAPPMTNRSLGVSCWAPNDDYYG